MRVDPITAILGIAMLLGGLVLSLVGVQDSYEVVVLAATRAVFALLAAILASLATMRFMPRTRVGRRLVLDTGFAARARGMRPRQRVMPRATCQAGKDRFRLPGRPASHP